MGSHGPRGALLPLLLLALATPNAGEARGPAGGLAGAWRVRRGGGGASTLGLFEDVHVHVADAGGDGVAVAVRWMAEPDGGEDVWENVTAPLGGGCSAVAESSKFFAENPFMGLRYAAGATRVTCAATPTADTLQLTETWTPTGSMGNATVRCTRTFTRDSESTMTLVIARSTRRRMPQTFHFERLAHDDTRAPRPSATVQRHSPTTAAAYEHRRQRNSNAKRAFSMPLDDDWRFDGGLADKVLLLSLQAWANAPPSMKPVNNASARDDAEFDPVLYFDYPADWDFKYTSALHSHLVDAKGFDFEPLDPRDLAGALRKVLPHAAVSSFVVWSPKAQDSINVALTAAGVYKALVVAEDHLPLVRSLGLTQAADFRGMFDGKSTLEVQRWAWETYGTRTNRSLVVMNGGPCCSGSVAKPAIADYGISRNAFFMSLDTRPEAGEEFLLARHILSQQNNFTMLMGWHKYGVDLERTFTSLASSLTLRVEGLHSLPNLSFMSRIRTAPGFVYRNNHNVKPGQVVKPDTGKVYIALVQTDSIGLGSWVDPHRGELPYAWEVPVNYVWLAPAILEFFYGQATPNDYFIGAISGPGYMYPRAIPESALPHVVSLSAGVMSILDLRVWETMDDSHGSTVVGDTDLTEAVAHAYLDHMPDLLGMVHGYAPSFTFGMGGDPRHPKPLLSFDYYLAPDPTPEECAADLEELAAVNLQSRAGPYFCVVHVREWSGLRRVRSVLSLLDPSLFSVVPLDTFLSMASVRPTFKSHFAAA